MSSSKSGESVPTLSRRGGEEMIHDAFGKWIKRHPVYVVVEVTGAGKDGEPYRVSGGIANVGGHVDQAGRTFPGSKARLVGFSTDRNWARGEGDEVG